VCGFNPASATIVNITYTGNVYYAQDLYGSLGANGPTIGQIVTATFFVNTDAAATNNSGAAPYKYQELIGVPISATRHL
jgi:hypothetical protein